MILSQPNSVLRFCATRFWYYLEQGRTVLCSKKLYNIFQILKLQDMCYMEQVCVDSYSSKQYNSGLYLSNFRFAEYVLHQVGLYRIAQLEVAYNCTLSTKFNICKICATFSRFVQGRKVLVSSYLNYTFQINDFPNLSYIYPDCKI